MYFIKENGKRVKFDKRKIQEAITASMRDGGVLMPDIARFIANDAEKYFSDKTPVLSEKRKYRKFFCLKFKKKASDC